MYTSVKTDIARLRAYRRELDARYVAAINRHDAGRAREIHGLRRRVLRSLLLHEEFAPVAPSAFRWDEVATRP